MQAFDSGNPAHPLANGPDTSKGQVQRAFAPGIGTISLPVAPPSTTTLPSVQGVATGTGLALGGALLLAAFVETAFKTYADSIQWRLGTAPTTKEQELAAVGQAVVQAMSDTRNEPEPKPKPQPEPLGYRARTKTRRRVKLPEGTRQVVYAWSRTK